MLWCAVALARAGVRVKRLYFGVTRVYQGFFAFTCAKLAIVLVDGFVAVRTTNPACASTLGVVVDCDVSLNGFAIYYFVHLQHNLLLFLDCTVLKFVHSKAFAHAAVKQHR